MLLAAGSGSRLGHRPKSLLELDGVPLIRRTIDALTQAGVCDLVVVLGHHRTLIEAALHGTSVRCVVNPQPGEGQVSSQRLGLAALGQGCAAVLVALADQPLITANDVRALLKAWHQRPPGVSVVYPQVNDQPGNPVVFGDDVRQQILRSDASVGARQWRQSHPEAVAPFLTANANYSFDIDTAEDVARFERETGRLLVWPLGLKSADDLPLLRD